MRKHQGLREYACTFGDCTESFSSLLRLQEHLKEHSGIRKIYKCELGNCNAVFSCYKTYRSHKRTVHKIFTKRPRKAKEKKSYACETCGKILNDRRSLTCHRYIHVDKSQWPFECDEENCTRRFRLKHLLLIHKRRHAGIKNYVCPICSARKTTSTELKIHINFHTFEQKFPCPSCPKVFKSVGCMRTHHNIVHDGKKPTYLKKKEQFKCSYCDRILASAQNKKQHETSHTGIGFVTCDECGKKYPSEVLLKKHKDNMHYKGECEFVCEECGKKCKSAINLKSHLKTHFKGEPPYACDECGKRFKRAIYLENHKLLHVEGATPYKCDECGMGFRWMGTLYGHIKKHKQQQIKSEREDEDDVSEI